MTWRIDEHVVRGVIDNRIRGLVTGRIWFTGRTEPVELKLTGNAAPDLAGRRLEFVNPSPRGVLPDAFASQQEGVAGDITASRKIRVADNPLHESKTSHEEEKPSAWHWTNALCLEWYSENNGRTVIETANYDLGIVGETAWEMTAEEDAQRQRDSAARMSGAIERLDASDDDEVSSVFADDEAGEWDETPPSEVEAEEAQARNDLLMDRIQARLAREGDDADYSQILHEEIERLRTERGEQVIPDDFSGGSDAWSEPADDAVDDPDLLAQAETEHPLAIKAFDLSVQLMAAEEEHGWVPENASEEHPAADLVGAATKAGAKLAGALNGTPWPPEAMFCASVIVRLKQARVYLDDALRASESCQEQALIAPGLLGPILVELIDLAHETDELIAELRERLQDGAE